MRYLAIALALAGSLATAGCLRTTVPIWQHYDACSAQTSSFPAMVACGKQRRAAACQENCSSNGNAFAQYADALAMAVKNKEMTEAEAMRRFAEYKTGILVSTQRDDAIMAAGAAAGGPRSCTKIGNTVHCD